MHPHNPLLTLRQIIFALWFYLSIALMGVVGLPLLAVPGRMGLNLTLAWMRVWLWLLFAAMRRLLGLDFVVKGREHIPPEKNIFASKHQSAFDTFVFLHLDLSAAYVLKQELFWVPIYGWYGKRVGMIGVDRGGHSAALRNLLKAAKAAIAGGRRIVIFPQGTRTPAGSGKPYQPGIYAIYRETGASITPIALNSGDYWPKHWLHRYPGTITIEFLPPIPPGLSRQALMARLESEIEAASMALRPPIKSPENAAPN